MITPDLKIAKLLSSYPQTLEILIKISPHFKNLEHKELRKTLATRLSVEQTAEIAGISTNTLLAELNRAIGIVADRPEFRNDETLMQKPSVGKPEFLEIVPQEKIRVLDVRPLLEAGRDPIDAIKAVVQILGEGEVFLLLNSFDPLPLYVALSKRGLKHWTVRENELYKVYFYRER